MGSSQVNINVVIMFGTDATGLYSSKGMEDCVVDKLSYH